VRRNRFVSLFVALFVSGLCSAQKHNHSITPGIQQTQASPQYEVPSATASAEELETRGDEYRTAKWYAAAISYYRAALAKTREKPAHAVLYNKAGIAELQLNHYRAAQKCFERASRYDPEYAEAYNNQGVALYLQRKYGKAIGRYRKAIELRDRSASFHSNLGTAYFMRRQTELAAAEYRRAAELDPEVFDRLSQTGVSARLSSPEDRAQYNYLLAKLFARAGNFDRSLKYLRKAIEEGYKPIKNVYQDQEFAGLRRDPRFADLMRYRPEAIN
jgi:tetratricopeptide (TPR) repeat protein